MGHKLIRRATYLCLDCAKNVDKNWNITVSFIIHVNFDHAWVEHYPVSLSEFDLIRHLTAGPNYETGESKCRITMTYYILVLTFYNFFLRYFE